MLNYEDLVSASQQMMPRCPICDTKYDLRRIKILEDSGARIMSHFKCQQCSVSFLASITEAPFGHLAAALMTDLEADEVLHFARSTPLGYDDVIAVHQGLEKDELEFN